MPLRSFEVMEVFCGHWGHFLSRTSWVILYVPKHFPVSLSNCSLRSLKFDGLFFLVLPFHFGFFFTFSQILQFRLAVVALPDFSLICKISCLCRKSTGSRRATASELVSLHFSFRITENHLISQRKRREERILQESSFCCYPVCLMQFFAVPWDTMMMMRSSTYRYCDTHIARRAFIKKRNLKRKWTDYDQDIRSRKEDSKMQFRRDLRDERIAFGHHIFFDDQFG